MNSLTSDVNRRVTALQAQALANDLLSDSLPDRFTADRAELTDNQWWIPVILAYPRIGSLGEVGEVIVDTHNGCILSHTPFEQMKKTGMELYQTHEDAIKAAFV